MEIFVIFVIFVIGVAPGATVIPALSWEEPSRARITECAGLEGTLRDHRALHRTPQHSPCAWWFSHSELGQGMAEPLQRFIPARERRIPDGY